MKDRIIWMTKYQLKQEKFSITLSDLNIEIEVEAGSSYDGSFSMTSDCESEIVAEIISTNDLVEVKNKVVEGKQIEVSYFFKGKLALVGQEIIGSFYLITNAGEYEIPYKINIVAPTLKCSYGKISTLDEFADLAAENWVEARELLFCEDFYHVFLKEDIHLLEIYLELVKGKEKDCILEEFLKVAGCKEIVKLYSDENKIILSEEEPQKVIGIKKEEWGYIKGNIRTQKGYFRVSCQNFTTNDFEDEVLYINVSMTDNYEKNANLEDDLMIETAYESLVIPIRYKKSVEDGKKPARQMDLELQMAYFTIYKQYLLFRTGKREFEEAANKIKSSISVLEARGEEQYFCELLRFQIAILGKEEDLDDTAKKIERKRKEYLAIKNIREYYYYLMALYKKDYSSVLEAVTQIQDTFEKRCTPLSFFFLLYLDKELIQDKYRQYQIIREFYNQGYCTCYLYFEVLELLNQNPNFMEQIGAFEIGLFEWGMRYGYISFSLSYRFTQLVSQEKHFSKRLFRILESLYQVEADSVYLSAICSMLIRGNRTGREYHMYFEKGIHANLKLIGLNEYYIRSIDYNSYPILPRTLLTYFTYSNSLDYMERAYLYTNVFLNREEYEFVYDTYEIKIQEFMKEQLMLGNINEYLVILYKEFLRDKTDHNIVKLMPNIIFRKKLICKNSNMRGVYVKHDEEGKHTYIPLIDGKCYVDLCTDNYILGFTDKSGNCYMKGIDYEIIDLLNQEDYMEICRKQCLEEERVLIHSVDSMIRAKEKKEEFVQVGALVLNNRHIKRWVKEQAIEYILDYYYEKKDIINLKKYLCKITYKHIRPKYRNTLMYYYVTTGEIENAYFGAELYGSGKMDKEQLYHVAKFGIQIQKNQRDNLTANMAYQAFLGEKYDNDTIEYLMEHYAGKLSDLLRVWDIAKREKMEQAEFEKRILLQALFTRTEEESQVFEVFLSYYEKEPDGKVIYSYIPYVASGYLIEGKKVPESFFGILGQECKNRRVRDLKSKVAYLYYYSDKKEIQDDAKETIKVLMREMFGNHMMFPFFLQFKDIVDFPKGILAKTFVTYHGESNQNVQFFYTLKDGIDTYERQVQMREVFDGIYVYEMYIFSQEEFDYYIVIDGKTKRGKEYITIENFYDKSEETRGTRFALLDQILEEEDEKMAERKMGQYMEKLQVLNDNLEMML